MKNSKKLIVGNWKMNPSALHEAKSLFSKMRQLSTKFKNTKTIICPPAVFLFSLGAKNTNSFSLGAQDVFYESAGAFTGQISPISLRDAKAEYVILGHSERRATGDTSEIVSKKIGACIKHLLTPIVCVGESVRDEDGNYMSFLRTQITETFSSIPKSAISKIIVAYEPLWSIGKGAVREATVEEANETIIFIRKVLSDIFNTPLVSNIPILYGGSANAKNAKGFLSVGNVNGLLFGRASLDPKEFGEILGIADGCF